MSQAARPLYQCPAFQEAGGMALRPGGLALTARGLTLCGFAAGARVADVGCGPGATLGLLAQRGLFGVGLDRDPGFLAQAQERGPVLRAQAQALPFPDAGLDGLVCECVLSTLDRPAAALAEMARVLRPGGRVLLTDLYVRGAASGAPVPGCLAGAVSREQGEGRLLAAGLRPLVFEDHGRALRELAGRLIFAHGSLELFWQRALGRETGCPDLRAVSYCLIIAEKERA